MSRRPSASPRATCTSASVSRASCRRFRTCWPRDVLPLTYALKIAAVPAEQQEEALVQCFRPLFRDEAARRDQLEPLSQLTAWVEKTVRLNPRGEDVQVLLPALAEQVVSAEQERDASVVALSTLHFHTDKADPKPSLAKSWKPGFSNQVGSPDRYGRGTRDAVCVV